MNKIRVSPATYFIRKKLLNHRGNKIHWLYFKNVGVCQWRSNTHELADLNESSIRKTLNESCMYTLAIETSSLSVADAMESFLTKPTKHTDCTCFALNFFKTIETWNKKYYDDAKKLRFPAETIDNLKKDLIIYSGIGSMLRVSFDKLKLSVFRNVKKGLQC